MRMWRRQRAKYGATACGDRRSGKSPLLAFRPLAPLPSAPMSSDLDSLRSVAILRNLDDAELSAFNELLTVREAKPKERLLEEGTVVDRFSIVFDGVVHIRRLAQKREMLLGRLGPGGFFGDINLFDPGLATASIYAMKQTQVGEVSYDKLRNFMESNPTAGYKLVSAMITEMARRLRQTSARLVHSVYWSSAAAAGES